MRWFIRQSTEGGRVCAFNQKYESKTCDVFLKIISEELNVKGSFYYITEAFLDYKNKQLEEIEKEYENNFNDYRDIDEKEMGN